MAAKKPATKKQKEDQMKSVLQAIAAKNILKEKEVKIKEVDTYKESVDKLELLGFKLTKKDGDIIIRW